MSVHDETWDKCPKCKQVIKTWHGDYHNSGGCLDFTSYHAWAEERKFIMGYESKTAAEKKIMIPNCGPNKSTDPPKSPFDDWSMDPERILPPNPIPEPLPAFYGSSMFPKNTEYQPEMMAFERDFVLCDLKFAIEAGMEYAQECLTRHDQELGRTTKKNKTWAETMEKDIAQMKQSLEKIKKYETGNLQ